MSCIVCTKCIVLYAQYVLHVSTEMIRNTCIVSTIYTALYVQYVLQYVQCVRYVLYVQNGQNALYSDGCGMRRGMGWMGANRGGEELADTAGG